jgi:hypothetical protein
MKTTIGTLVAICLSISPCFGQDVDYLDAWVLFKYSDNSNSVAEVAQFKLYPGNMSELHSRNEYVLLPGGEWDLELRYKKNKELEIKMGVPGDSHKIINSGLEEWLTKSILLKSDKEGELFLKVLPKVALSLEQKQVQGNFGLDHMCFDKSPIIVDDQFYIGEFTAFGERALFGATNLANVEFSLKPMRDWKPIGEYLDGVITFNLEGAHQVKIFNVGMGPSGFKKGGPFTVFGKIEKSEHSREEAEKISIDAIKRSINGTRQTVLIEALKKTPYIMTYGTIGNDSDPGPFIEPVIGNVLEGQKCG